MTIVRNSGHRVGGYDSSTSLSNAIEKPRVGMNGLCLFASQKPRVNEFRQASENLEAKSVFLARRNQTSRCFDSLDCKLLKEKGRVWRILLACLQLVLWLRPD